MAQAINPTGRFSIPTEYKGIRFRSKLEADWARFFDGQKIKWEYEPTGIYVGDQFTLCDFHLPEVRQWFEVKGVWTEAESEKYLAFADAIDPEDLFVGGPHGLLAGTWDGNWEAACAVGCSECGLTRFERLDDERRCRCSKAMGLPNEWTRARWSVGRPLPEESRGRIEWPSGRFVDSGGNVEFNQWLWGHVS